MSDQERWEKEKEKQQSILMHEQADGKAKKGKADRVFKSAGKSDVSE